MKAASQMVLVAVARLQRLLLVLLACRLALACAQAESAQPRAPQTPQILILNSYHPGDAWSDAELLGLTDRMNAVHPAISPSIEFLDEKRFPAPQELQLVEEFLQRKYAGRHIDLIVALDNPAFNMICGSKPTLFPDVPAVFAGVDGFNPSMIAAGRNVTGIAQYQDLAATVEMAVRLLPATREVYVLHDYTETGLSLRKEAEVALAGVDGIDSVRYSPNVGFPEIENEIRSLQPGTIVLLLSFVTDGTGTVYTRRQIAASVPQVSAVPVFATLAPYLGDGIVGGMVVDGQEHGARAADLVMQVLAGKSPSSIPVTRSVSRAILDFRAMQRWDIPSSRWPSGANIINRPVSPWELDRPLLVPMALVLGTLVVFLGILLIALLRVRRSSAALREGERHYREVFDATGEAIFILDVETGKTIDVNEAAVIMYGYDSKEEILSRHIAELSSGRAPFTYDAGIKVLENTQAHGPQTFEWLARRKDGTEFWVEVAIRSSDIGGRDSYLAVARDITARREAEQALRIHEQIVSSTPDALAFIGPDFRFKAVNATNTARTGLTGESLVGMHVSKVLGRDLFEQALRPRIERALAGETVSFSTWFQYARAGRMYCEVTYSPCRDENGDIIGVVGLSRDITERQRVEEELRESEARFRLLLDHVPELAVQGYELDGRVFYWNDSSERLYGYSAAEAMGRNLLDLIIPPDSKDAVRQAMAGMAETRQPIPTAELNLMRKDGTLVPVLSGHAIVEVPGKPAILFCMDVDLTERKRAEAEREKLEAQLVQAQKMEAIGRLAGGVAHDFNNMLQTILGYAELALTHVDAGDRAAMCLHEIQRAGEHSANLTRQLLAFARRQTIAPRVLDLNEGITSMLGMLGRLVGEDFSLICHPGHDLGMVRIDPAQLDQILANLVVNSRDAMSHGGQILIHTENVHLDEEQLAEHPAVIIPGDYVMLSVRDNGAGMDEVTLRHLFEPFFTTKELGKGTGLGLATVYGIVKQNNGFIGVQSAPGEGTTFRIYFPRIDAPKPVDVAPTPALPQPKGKETVLLVEDEGTLLQLAQTLLERLGYTVLAAGTPCQAMDLVKTYPEDIHLVLTDVVMPVMSGQELWERIRPIRPSAKCLFMSGYTADVLAPKGVLGDGVQFLQKPFRLGDLAAKIRETLEA